MISIKICEFIANKIMVISHIKQTKFKHIHILLLTIPSPAQFHSAAVAENIA